MRGMSRTTGGVLDGAAHIRQSIHDILSTRVGSRVMLRTYGSDLPNLVDDPQGQLLDVELYAATAQALDRWEPRFKLLSVWLSSRSPEGRVIISVEGHIIEDGAPLRIEGITL